METLPYSYAATTSKRPGGWSIPCWPHGRGPTRLPLTFTTRGHGVPVPQTTSFPGMGVPGSGDAASTTTPMANLHVMDGTKDVAHAAATFVVDLSEKEPRASGRFTVVHWFLIKAAAGQLQGTEA